MIFIFVTRQDYIKRILTILVLKQFLPNLMKKTIFLSKNLKTCFPNFIILKSFMKKKIASTLMCLTLIFMFSMCQKPMEEMDGAISLSDMPKAMDGQQFNNGARTFKRTKTYSHPYRLAGERVGGFTAKFVFTLGNKIMMVDENGVVWAQRISDELDKIGGRYRIEGAPVAVGGVPVKSIYGAENNKIVALNEEHELWISHVNEEIDYPYSISNFNIIPEGAKALFIFTLKNQLITYTTSGDFISQNIAVPDNQNNTTILNDRKINFGKEAKLMFSMGNRIMVVSKEGFLWESEVVNSKMGEFEFLQGPRVAVTGTPAIDIFALGDSAFGVLNTKGEVWVCKMNL